MAAKQKFQSFADQLLQELRTWEECDKQIISSYVVPPQEAEYATINATVQKLLPAPITSLYSHQAQTIKYALQQQHVTIATATASGKTLALTLPARIRRLTQEHATLLCIAPTRALVQQWTELLTEWDDSVSVASYTGDTPQNERRALRNHVQCLVTTPDMLHKGLLPYHHYWHRFLSSLRDVIIDESHIYRGVFGSHVGHILRRLQRVVPQHHAPIPTFLCASATIGNPADHASQLLHMPVEAITHNGAPNEGRRMVLWQPPDKRSHSDEAAGLMAFFLAHDVRTILFGQERQSIERMLRHVRRQLPSSLGQRVVAYRGGYMPEKRQEMQRQLAAGELLGVVTTNALELGIDIGGIDVVISDGFPGSIASFWQQAGRAGRRGRSALNILVLREDALDQYFAAHPETLFAQPIEHALINVNNPYILAGHLRSAAYEHPLNQQELADFSPIAQRMCERLVQQGYFQREAHRYVSREQENPPAYHIDIRQIGKRLAIRTAERVIEETDTNHAVTECFPGAVYFSQGRSYVVEQLDLERGAITVSPRELSYYTEPSIHTYVDIQRIEQQKKHANVDLFYGNVMVTRHVVGFVKKHPHYHRVLDTAEFEEAYEINLPTKAVWITFEDDIIKELLHGQLDPAGSLHAAEHGMIALLPLFVMGDRRDVGGVSILPRHPETGKATIFIYDGYPGGIGYTEEAYRQFPALVKATYDTIKKCTCEGGCYACVQSPKCGNQNRPLDKEGAITLLQTLLQTDREP
ncbi:MAG TPA: DEAD/DEAH box helicase [Dictyobacter sp.]|jgi:DEAD/DEAH box helicase domain-containing protein|nr:DEAD/DEAH box helicase [Dictyobacter sp.]